MNQLRVWVLILVGLGLIGFALWWRQGPPGSGAPTRSVGSPVAVAPVALTKEERQRTLRDAPEAHLADELNKPGGTLREDVAIVGSMIAAYRSNYPGRGNPVGDNREITETLLGRNPNGIIFLPAGHPAINAQGELCDRWGTPFRFHAESGLKMEVRSAGPDRQWWTPDDVFLVP